MLWRRILRSLATPPPLWVTTSPLSDGEWEEPYAQPLLATGASAYGLPSGSLPPGLALVGDTISGTPRPAPTAPVWGTAAGSLGTATQGDSFAATLSASGAASFAVRAGRLPWGVTLDVETGAISGTLAVIGGASDDPGPPPVWVTAGGSLGNLREGQAASVSLAASGAATYTLVGGVFPWGLTLDAASGAISGTAANVDGGAWEPGNTITWSAPASTNLGSFAQGATVGPISQTTSIAGAFYISAGGLPWGLTMSATSGAISGTISPEAVPVAYGFTVACASADGASFGTRAYSITVTPMVITMAWNDGTNFNDGTGWV